jgi:hypothetical protein
VKAFDNARGKWRAHVPEIATSLLVSLSARLLKWQNPGEACGDLLQVVVVERRRVSDRIAVLAHMLRSFVASS